jgi:hypothetical protein
MDFALSDDVFLDVPTTISVDRHGTDTVTHARRTEARRNGNCYEMLRGISTLSMGVKHINTRPVVNGRSRIQSHDISRIATTIVDHFRSSSNSSCLWRAPHAIQTKTTC